METASILLWIASIFTSAIGIYYASFFKKKGENLATKEDLAELTKITEGIKSELHVVSQRQIGVDSEIRSAIINFNDTLSQTVDTMTLAVWTSNHLDAVSEFFKAQYPKYSLAESRLSLFTQDSRIAEITHDIKMNLFNMLILNSQTIPTLTSIPKKTDGTTDTEKFKELVIQHHKSMNEKVAPIVIAREKLNKIFKEYFI